MCEWFRERGERLLSLSCFSVFIVLICVTYYAMITTTIKVNDLNAFLDKEIAIAESNVQYFRKLSEIIEKDTGE